MFRRGGPRQERQRQMGVYLLAYQMMSGGPIPPVTLGAILLQIAIFLGYVPPLASKYTRSLCLLPSRVLASGEWYRLLAPVVMHGDDMHLYYNMVSLLWKGRKLESRLGGPRFAVILAVFSLASTAMTVAVSLLLDEVAGLEYMHQCAVGFSGVLFALKVLMNSYFPNGHERIMGIIPVPGKYVCWAELILIQLLTPNVSFVGHLAGILVGLLYTMGPLKMVVDAIMSPTTMTNTYQQRRGAYPSAPPQEDDYDDDHMGSERAGPSGSAFYGRGAATGATNQFSEYTGGLSEEEQLQRATEESMRQRGRGYGWNMD